MELAKYIKPLASELDWPIWKRKMRDLLDYHEGTLNVIDGKLRKPQALAADATAEQIKNHKDKFDQYRKANSYAKSMLTTAVTDAVYQKIMDKETAHDVWEALKLQFEATSKDQLFKICTDFFAFNWTPGDDVSTHVAKLRSLWNELNSGLQNKKLNALPDLMLVCKILQILPSSFETFRSGWMLLTKDDDKTFDELAMQLCMYERNFTRSAESSVKQVQEALVAKAERDKREAKIKYSKKNTRKDDICNYCKMKGHWVKTCKKWIAEGRPPKNREGAESQSNVAVTTVALISISEELNRVETDSTDWWIDNGATKHVTNCSNVFISYEQFPNSCSIKAAGKENLTALGKGTIRVVSTVENTRLEMTLNDVWYVPNISKNLFSVLAAQDRNQSSEFRSTATRCWLKVNGRKVLCGVREVGGTLLKADIKSVVPECRAEVNVSVSDNSLLQLYHERWGHQDKRHVKKMLEKELGISVKLNNELCEPCIYGKAHRLPFGTRKAATRPGQLISSDVCGPFDESFQKKRYFVIFKDSYTKFRYGYFIKTKSEVKNALEHMIAHAKTSGHTIQELLSDNGGEFDNDQVREVLSANGITQKLTAPYSPEQNGGSERENRTVVEMARTFKYSNHDIQFPESIWAELVNTAIYILNRTAKSSVEGISPYEMWLGQKPRIKHLRIIGSASYTHIPKQNRRKMEKKAIKGYLIGYDGDERYRIWVKESHKVILSRDVKFQEEPGGCIEHVKLPLRDSQPESISKEKNEDSDEKSEEDEEQVEDRDERIRKEEVEQEDDVEEIFSYNLRNRLNLRQPKQLEDYVLIAEDLVNSIQTPETYEEAISSPESNEWKEAMTRELLSLKENETWELTSLPEGARALPCRWVFRVKTNPDGSIDKYKARLVIKGFNQRRGIDYNQTFSPVTKMSTIRSILSIAVTEKMHLAQFDVSTAFLYGKLDETIYMDQPQGYNDDTDKICRLRRSLYGLKQAPRCWNRRFGGFLVKLGFKVSEADPCLYLKEENGDKLILALYVDDGLTVATDSRMLENFLMELKKEFKITIKHAEYFLGIEIEKREDGSMKICQKAHARKILERFNFAESKPISTPILKNPETSKSGKEGEANHNFPYRQAVGVLMYLMLGTRPDLAYSVGILSRSLENPSLEDVVRVKRVFRYIAGTIDLGIVYSPEVKKNFLECYSDSDFAGCTSSGRSTTGVVICYAGGAISWQSQRQSIVATSTTEAEIIAATEATKEVIWLTRLFQGIIKLKQIPVLQVDNSAAVKLAQNPEFHRRTKHIAVKHFFVREKVTEGNLDIQQISSEEQVADIMTKALPRQRLQVLCAKMGLNFN